MKSKIPPFIFFGAFLLLGVIIFKDYGVGWDELKNRQYGNITIDYVLGNDQDAGYYKDPEDFWNPKSGQFAKTHGPVFEVALVAAEKALHLDDQREKYLLRHIGTFLAFFLSVLFFYMLCRHIFSSMGTALLGSLFFALTPRIFAASFNDSMDIAFMMMFAASMYTMVRYLDAQNVFWAVLHAAACAVMIDIRISGILIPVITILFVVFDTLVSKTSPKTFKKAIPFLRIRK